jgi:hypothetical protein
LARSWAAAASAQQAHLPAIEIVGPRDAAIGTADSASEGAVERESFQARPKLRPGDIVEAVPGVVATQHSGDGKANQYFLRGFNLDHGTDFAVTVDGMPVNMPTHGHGQGYADLNFLIPELVSGVRYRKGPYFARAATSRWRAARRSTTSACWTRPLPKSRSAPQLQAPAGRGLAHRADQTWLGAIELEGNDGPWDVPENLRKVKRRAALLAGLAHARLQHHRHGLQEPLDLDRPGARAPDRQRRALALRLAQPHRRRQDPAHEPVGQVVRQGAERRDEISAYAIDYRFDLFSTSPTS